MPFHQRSNPNSGPTRRSARPGSKRRRGTIHGVVDEIDPGGGRIRIRVGSGRGAGKRMVGETVLLDAGGAELSLPDADGDRGQSLRDVFPGNEVEVRFAQPPGEESALRALKVIHHGPDMPVGGLRRLWR